MIRRILITLVALLILGSMLIPLWAMAIPTAKPRDDRPKAVIDCGTLRGIGIIVFTHPDLPRDYRVEINCETS